MGKNVKIKTFIESNNDINLKTFSVYQSQNNDLFLLVDNENSFSNINYENIWYCLHELRKHLSNSNTKLSIIKQHYNPQIKWEMIYPMLRYIFKDKQIEITILNNDLIIPSDSEKETILKELHDNPLGGHQGVSRTFKKISKLYTWKGMKKDVKKFVKKCELCQKNKLSRRTKKPMAITTTASKPFEKCFLDIVGPLPVTESENKYILTFQDDLTKFNINIPMKNQEATTVASHFVSNIICSYGVPEILVTDQGSNFLSEIFKNTWKLLKIKKNSNY